jgi:hypothetical protein
MTCGSRQRLVDDCWTVIQKWFEDALTTQCGTLTYSPLANREFFSKELMDLSNELTDATAYAQSLLKRPKTDPERQRAWNRANQLGKRLREAANKRRTELFQSTVDLLDEPRSRPIFAKMVSSLQRRDTRTTSALDPRRINEYAGHFGTSFGASPSHSIELVNAGILRMTDPSGYVVPSSAQITTDSVSAVIKQLPNGKAAGADALFSEALAHGGEIVEKVLALFFTICRQSYAIPGIWKTALDCSSLEKEGQ